MATHALPNVSPPPPGAAILVEVAGRSIAVFNLGSQLAAIDAKCTHVGGPLVEGAVSGSNVTCPWHGSEFDLTTGAVKRGPATRPVRSYPIRAQGSGLAIDIE
ncbi:MAG TPA: Rieske (2Fe-2S) protein [Thermoplasmata archaeon]|nr:Rieske (2Fe-2S) protein [Thermoplasmata archaeon]